MSDCNGTINTQDKCLASIGDNNINTVDNSITYNITINIDQRGNLKNLHDGKEHEFVMFCIEEREDIKKVEGTRMVLCTNIYSNYEFITDHAFVTFPEKWYDEFSNYNLIKVKAKVYKYKRGDGTEDYSFIVTSILDMTNRMINLPRGQFLINKYPNTIEQFDENMSWISDEDLYDIVFEQLMILDTTISNNNNIRQGFISGLIMTRYFLNTQLQLLTNQQKVLRNVSREALIDIFKLLSTIMYSIDKGETYLWRHILQQVNEICNYFQGIKYEFNNRTKEERQIIFNNIKVFANKIIINNYKKLHGICKVYNRNIGYLYPSDNKKFEEILRFNALSYLLSKGYFKIAEK